MSKRSLDKLRRQAEENIAVNDRKIKGMGKADLATMAHELAVHQAELEIQNEELLQSRALAEETRERYQQLFDFAPVGYFTLDEHYRVIEVNLNGYQLLKVEKGKLKNKIFTRFIADGETDNFYLHRKKALKTGLSQNFILQMKKDDGTLFYAQLDIVKDFGETLRLAVSDITERKKAEDAQRQSEENYRTLFNSIDEGFCVIEVIFNSKNKPIDYRFLEINPAFEKQTGLHDAEGKLMRNLAPEHEEHWFRIYGKIALTGKSERFVNEARALSRWYDVYAFRVGLPESRKVAILFNDITARKKAEDDLAKVKDELEIKVQARTSELKEIEEKLRSVLDNSRDFIYRANLQTGMYEYVSPSVKVVLGYTPYEFAALGTQSSMATVHPDDIEAVQKALKSLEETGTGEMEYRLRNKQGEYLWVSNHLSVVKDISGRPLFRDGNVRDITDRKNAEDELKESEERFSKAFRSSPTAMAITKIIDGTFIDVNDGYERLIGYTRQEVIGYNTNDLNVYVYPDQRAEIVRLLNENGKIIDKELKFRKKDGQLIDTVCSFEVIRVRNQDFFLSSILDITERKKGEEALKDSEMRFRLAMRHAPVSVAVQDLDLKYIWAYNQHTADPDQIIGHYDKDIFTPEEAAYVTVFKRRVIEEDIDLSDQMWLNRPGGRIFLSLFWEPIHDESGRVIGVGSTTVDLTQVKQAEEKNRELSAIVESADDAIIGKTSEGIITSWNKGAENMYGYTESEVIGKPVSILVPPDRNDEVPQFLDQMVPGENIKPFETVRLKKDGQEIPVLLTISPILDDNGKVIGASTIGHDISERRNNEQIFQRYTNELEASNKELEAFSYSVSHDLRAPLRSITGFSNVLLEDYSKELDDEGKSYLKKISDSGELMGQLMDDLLKLSRVTRSDLTMEKLDLSDMARKIVGDLIKDEPKRKVKVTIAPNMTANGDKNLLGLALQNLLGNAWKYSSKTAEPLIEMGTVEYKGKQTYFVRDNGVGFDMAHASKLFQPFQRLHKASEFAGTGVGLATVQRIIRRHGGDVWAESKVGEGATFYFTLS